EKINSYENEFEKLSDSQLKEKTLFLKQELKNGKTLDDILPESFALVREASKRTLNQRHFDVQLIGGIVLHQGKIAEMKTGEGKTLTATLPLFLNALEGKGCHLVTVNDYLAKRDTVWMGQIYDFLGLSVACIVHDSAYIYDKNYKNENQEKDKERDLVGGFKVVESYLRNVSRKEAYAADITYGTNNEFGFDYLRDNLVYDIEDEVQRGFNYAIVDEVDSILIDEARTPLIISGQTDESTDKYYQFAQIVKNLKEEEDYLIDEKFKSVSFTEEGQNKIVKSLGFDPWAENDISTAFQLEAALKAKTLFKRDKDYVVKDGEVIIVDEFTGRLMPKRRWSEGLHQAIEAKEGIKIQPESKTFATITFQNYFRMYKKLSGMTGTAATSAEEFDKVYNLEVVIIPTNKKMIRVDLPDRVYKTIDGKFRAVVKEIKERNQKGQPVLVGTVSIEKNEYLSKLLSIEGISHQLLNAKNHEKEGEIIAQAGKLNAVTIATNMAGRGVDIILGGNPPDEKEAEEVRKLGGLFVIGTERHEARRIDNQLRGRAGRQGDPGVSQFFLSLEDDLLRIFGGDRIKSLMDRVKIDEDQPIESNIISKAIESAQEKVEGLNFDLRKHLLEYDDVMNKHREVFYKKRKEILLNYKNSTLRNYVIETIKRAGYNVDDYINKEKEIGEENMREVERFVCFKVLDTLWIEHLEDMEYLRDAVKLRAYGQKDPLVEYKSEAHQMFKKLLETIDLNIAKFIFQAQLKPQNQKINLIKSS
ncbi:MAG TPA: preprotein translocase subunit SecA, partial [Candidatus Pacearchaeota archaeon]|nr:preprotein translocase subunit SecA [Candidatus Pacearchaeota archaeon]